MRLQTQQGSRTTMTKHGRERAGQTRGDLWARSAEQRVLLLLLDDLVDAVDDAGDVAEQL